MATEIQWLEIILETTAPQLDTLTAKLTANGVTGMVIEEEGEFLRFLEENRQFWDYVDQELLDSMAGVCRVKVYVSDDDHGKTQLEEWLQGIDAPYTSVPLKENDWAHSWQKYYKPSPVGDRLYIVPQWEEDAVVPEGRVPLILNPGLAFGTGSHPTTRLCLEGLEGFVVENQPVLDLGCGSGILSIATLVLGASHAVAVDIDPKASTVAYENAQMNHIEEGRYAVHTGNVIEDEALAATLAQERYPLVLANIVADVIIPLSAMVHQFLTPEGVFLCSGIIDTRAHEVEEALTKNGLTIFKKYQQKGWVALAARMK